MPKNYVKVNYSKIEILYFQFKYKVNSIRFVIARKSGLIPFYIRILIGRKS